jgi:hypothetical protein
VEEVPERITQPLKGVGELPAFSKPASFASPLSRFLPSRSLFFYQI